MDKRSFMFGLGIGVFLCCFIFFFLYTWKRDEFNAAIVRLEVNGAVASETPPSSFLKFPDETEPEILQSETPFAPTPRVTETPPVPTPVITETPPAPTPITTETPIISTPGITETPPVPTPAITETPSPLPAMTTIKNTGITAKPGYVIVTIPEGATSREICQILQDNGVVDDAADYDNYLILQSYTKKIRYGSYELPIKGDYKEILDIIKL